MSGIALDIRTLFMTMVTVSALQCLLLLLTWGVHRRISALGWWGAGNGAVALGTLLVGLRGHVPDPVSILAGNVFVMAGLLLCWLGIRRFEERPLPLRLAAGFLAGFALVLGNAPLGPEALATRTVICASALALLYASCGFELLRRPASWFSARRLTATLFAIQSLFQLARVVGNAVAPQQGHFMAQADPLTGVHLLVAVLASVALTFSLLFMASQRLQEEVDRLAARDGLTQLLNRRAFLDLAGRDFARARRSGAPLCLLVMDIDRFKAINDGHGHHAGDAVLRRFADLLRQNLREHDVVCRYGGEEFCALLPDTSGAAALLVAERIRAAFGAAAVEEDGRVISTTVSIGMAQCRGGCPDVDALIRSADQALYAAKAGGRNRVVEAPCEALLGARRAPAAACS